MDKKTAQSLLRDPVVVAHVGVCSGYTDCPCCGDVTVSSDVGKPELCELCEEAGCDPGDGPEGCQRNDTEDE